MPRTSRPTSLWRMVASILAATIMVTKTAMAFRPSVARTVANSATATASSSAWAVTLFDRDPRGISGSRLFASVTGSVYEAGNNDGGIGVVVTLYTKEGCTLCDKVKDVLETVRNESEGESENENENQQFAHSLRQIDITDDDQQDSYDRYKYDIPVLHIGTNDNDIDIDIDIDNDSVYWTKHRLTVEEAKEAIAEAMGGSFEPRKGRPNASALER